MASIASLLARAAALRDETALNSISPERAGGIMYDTLLAMNELWLQQGAALVISKIYASVAAMNADNNPVSDLTGQPLRPGMIVVIASSDVDNGHVYRYNGTSSPRWSDVGLIGNIDPIDSLDSDSTAIPLAAHQGKVLDGKITQLGQDISDEFTNYPLYNYTLRNNGLFGTSSSSKHSSAPVTEGQKFIIVNTGSTNDVKYAFATSNDYSSGAAIPLVAGTGVKTVSNSNPETVIIPSGCSYLLFNVSTDLKIYDYQSKAIDIFDISEYNDGTSYDTLELAITAIPYFKKKSGMVIKFLKNARNYHVFKQEGLEEAPEGTAILDDPNIETGNYTKAQLSVFSSLPPTLSSLTYYIAVTDTNSSTTYTSWIITKLYADSRAYVFFKYKGINIAGSLNNTDNWQGVDEDFVENSPSPVSAEGIEIYDVKNGELLPWSRLQSFKGLNTDAGTVTFSDNSAHKVIPVNEGDSVVYKANVNNPSYIVINFVADYSAMSSENWLLDSLYSVKLNAGQKATRIAPKNTRFIVVTDSINGTKCVPDMLTINGYDVLKGGRTVNAEQLSDISFDNIPTPNSKKLMTSGSIDIMRDSITGINKYTLSYIKGSYYLSNGALKRDDNELCTQLIDVTGVRYVKTNIKRNNTSKVLVFLYSSSSTSDFIRYRNYTSTETDFFITESMLDGAKYIAFNIIDDGVSSVDTSGYYLERYYPRGLEGTVKFTPQTLSITEKNQAITNLGLDGLVSRFNNDALPIRLTDIASNANLDGEYDTTFSIDIPVVKNMPVLIVSRAKYILPNGGTTVPTIKYTASIGNIPNTYHTKDGWEAEIGSSLDFIDQQFRAAVFAPLEGTKKWITITVTIPTGVKLYLEDFFIDWSDYMGNCDKPKVTFVSHGGIYGEFNCLSQFNAARVGYRYMVVVPKRTSDGVWVCFHDDDNINQLAYSNNQLVCVKNGSTYTKYDSEGNVIGNNAMPISSVTWEFLSTLWYYKVNKWYNNEKVMRLDDCLRRCQQTGMHIVFSVHPNINSSEMDEIGALLKKYNMMKSTIFKPSGYSLVPYIQKFGYDVEGYSIYNVSQTQIDEVIALGIDTTKVKVGFELPSSTATQSAIENILNSESGGVNCGFFVSVYTTQNSLPAMKNFIELGVTWFTENVNTNNGLIW